MRIPYRHIEDPTTSAAAIIVLLGMGSLALFVVLLMLALGL